MPWQDAPLLESRLNRALAAFDWPAAEAICSEIIDRIATDPELLPEVSGRLLMQSLRGKRRFPLMTRLAEALLQSGLRTPQIRRQYAQALIDQGILAAGEMVLQSVIQDSQGLKGEELEARGLTGRIYKQLYINNRDPRSTRNRANLERALSEYLYVYRLDPQAYLWHGINVVALLDRAKRDQVSLAGLPDASGLARDILQTIQEREQQAVVPSLPAYDMATMMEACIALGFHQEAADAALRYVDSIDANAFEIASTVRQLAELWQLNDQEPPGNHLLPILKAGHLRKEGGMIVRDPKQVREEAASIGHAMTQLEAIFGPDRMVTLTWYKEELTKTLKYLEAEEHVAGVLVSPNDRFTAILQSYLAENSLEAGKVKPLDGGGLEAQFDEHDILGWAKSLFSWVKRLRPHKWQTAPTTPDQLPNTLRVGILGDWGTGLYGAPVCAVSIQNDPLDYGLLLHLGDVYYSGTDSEVTDRFLGLWPKKPNAIHRACNSNHEMYSGGYAYFGETLKQFKQPASYFALQNDHWLLVGLDSAYEEGELAHGQIAWLQGLMMQSGDRRVVLFSHHQLFSWAEKFEATLQAQLGELLTSKRLFAWYWGHEHRCMIYDRHPIWNVYGRCVGHSGFPYFRDKFTEGRVIERGPQDTTWRKVHLKHMVPGGLILEGPNPYIPGHEHEYGPHGYMTLEFTDDQLNEIVHAPDGSPVYARRLA